MTQGKSVTDERENAAHISDFFADIAWGCPIFDATMKYIY